VNKYEIRTNQKKENIVHAALELFNSKGFSNTTIKEIALFAKVSQVSIYNYFGSKNALVTECAKVIMEDTFKKAKLLLVADMNFNDKLVAALSLCTNKINYDLNNYLSKAALSDPALLNLLYESFNDLKCEIYVDYIELGKKEKVFDSTISNDTILFY
jgi:AcrR family transcriptional regulator